MPISRFRQVSSRQSSETPIGAHTFTNIWIGGTQVASYTTTKPRITITHTTTKPRITITQTATKSRITITHTSIRYCANCNQI